MTEVKETGGARIGLANATWPFATLIVNNDELRLSAGIIGSVRFKAGDIISIVPYLGFLSKGIKINHKIPSYPSHIVFWTFSNPKELVKKIDQTGFLSNEIPMSKEMENNFAKLQSQGRFPIKTSAAIFIVVIWNILFLTDFRNFSFPPKTMEGLFPGYGVQFALGFMLLTCILLLVFEPVRRLILKDGHTIGEIRNFIFLIMLICGLMLIFLVMMMHSNLHHRTSTVIP